MRQPAFSLNELHSLKTHAFIVGSGPSLDLNVDLLPEVHKKRRGHIFITDGALARWKKVGYLPRGTYVFTAETDFQGWTNRNTTEMLLSEDTAEYYRDIPLIVPLWGNHKFIQKWKGPIYFYLDRDYRYIGYYEHFEAPKTLPSIFPRNSTVGFHAISVARYLKMKAVVCLGMDYSTQRGKYHCDDFPIDGDWDVDMKGHYENHIKWFQTYYKGEFDICVTNSTQGGIMYRPSVNCHKHDLRDFLEQEIPYE